MDFFSRKATRLPGYDYSTPGYYFVTVCTYEKKCILGKIVGEGLCALPSVVLSDIGKEVDRSIEYMRAKQPGVAVDQYIIMPNHIHLLLQISEGEGGRGGPPLQRVIGQFKSYTTHIYGKRLWQRSFHDHVIRGEKDYREIWQYITCNAAKWKEDRFYCG